MTSASAPSRKTPFQKVVLSILIPVQIFTLFAVVCSFLYAGSAWKSLYHHLTKASTRDEKHLYSMHQLSDDLWLLRWDVANYPVFPKEQRPGMRKAGPNIGERMKKTLSEVRANFDKPSESHALEKFEEHFQKYFLNRDKYFDLIDQGKFDLAQKFRHKSIIPHAKASQNALNEIADFQVKEIASTNKESQKHFEKVMKEFRGVGLLLGVVLILIYASLNYILVRLYKNDADLSQKLEHSKSFLSSILDYMPGPVYSKAPDGKYLFVNRKYLEVVPVPEGNISEMTDRDIFPPPLAEELMNNDRKVREDKREVYYKENVPHPDGSVRNYDTYKFPIFDANGEIISVTGISIDITDKMELQKNLETERIKAVHNAKLASLGEMSAGIAHEINNPLAIISGTVATLARIKDDPEKFKVKLTALSKACDRVSKIVLGLRKFSRTSDQLELQPVSIREIFDESAVFFDSKSKHAGIPVTISIETNASILCDSMAIEQVLINLVSNSFDAIKNLSEKWVRVRAFETNDAVVLQVTDSGHGIPVEIEEKIFHPFFTTKPVGEGTGLGLSISKGILADHGAQISVNRSVKNTCFEIRFKKESSTLKHAA